MAFKQLFKSVYLGYLTYIYDCKLSKTPSINIELVNDYKDMLRLHIYIKSKKNTIYITIENI